MRGVGGWLRVGDGVWAGVWFWAGGGMWAVVLDVWAGLDGGQVG